MSKQPRKQRKERFQSPLHLKRKMLAAHLSKEAREKLKTKRRSLVVRKGDKVKVLRGDKKGHVGKVARVDIKKIKVFVEGVTSREAKGTEKLAPVDPSNLLIIEAGASDKERLSVLERSKK